MLPRPTSFKIIKTGPDWVLGDRIKYATNATSRTRFVTTIDVISKIWKNSVLQYSFQTETKKGKLQIRYLK